MTIGNAYNHYVEKLNGIYHPGESSTIADWVFESLAGIKRLDRRVNKQKPLDDLHLKKLADALEDLLQHRPVQYVLGEAWWFKMKLFVNEHVLIPRPETEELVQWIIDVTKKSENKKIEIIDIGTGSGCIAIALKKELPGANIVATDISADASFVARRNAAEQNAAIEVLLLDFLDEETWHKLPLFDIIASNPPYIPQEEKSRLKDNVLKFEPHLALFVPDKSPFIFYEKIASFAKLHLNKNGKILVEVHEEFAAQVQNIFSQNGFYQILRKDMFGRDRMICSYR